MGKNSKDNKKSNINHLPLTIAKRLESLLANTGDTALKRRARRIIEELNPQKGDKILDVGCGDGFYLHLLSSLGLKLKLTGFDNDARALESARKNLKGKRIKFVEGDLMKKPPFKDNSFDKVVMSEVVEHLPDDVKGLKEVYRILKPGGVLALSVPNANYPFFWDPINWVLEHLFNTHIKTGFWAGIWSQHVRLYKLEEIKEVMKKASFRVVKAESLTVWCLPFNHHIINLGARILAGGGEKTYLTSGANKFRTRERKSLIPAIYFGMSSFIDMLNDNFPDKNIGVSVFVMAVK